MENILIVLIIPLFIMILLLMLDFPIYVAMLSAAIYLQVFVNDMSLQTTVVTMVKGIAKPSILAVPFFVFAGTLIGMSGIGERIILFIRPYFEKVRGGMAFSSILANGFFGAISGSAPAAVAAIGKVIFDPLAKSEGDRIAIGVITSSGGIAVIIPPSISLILFGIATDTSVGQLFMAGLIPGLLMIAIVGAYVIIASPSRASASENQTDEYKNGAENTGESFFQFVPIMLLPILVLGGIYGGIFTPTEAGAVSAVYAMLAAIFYRELNWKKLKASVKESSETVGKLFILVACSLSLAGALTLSGLPDVISSLVEGLHLVVFLLLLNLVLIIAGAFFEPGAVVLVLAPLFAPVAYDFGIHPLHLGVIFTINTAIGMFTPPFGFNIFVVQGVLGQPFEKIVSSIIPFLIAYIVCLIIITFVPSISLWLPSVLM